MNFDRVPFLLQFNISSSLLDTLPTRISSGSSSSIATWLSPTSFPHPTESPGPFGRPRKNLHSQQTPSTDQEKCHPMQSQSPPRHLPDALPTAVRPPRFAQLPHHMGFNQPVLGDRHQLSIDRLPPDLFTKPKKWRLQRLIVHELTRSSPSFRGFNVLLRGLLSPTRKETSTLRVHGPLVLDEGEEGILTTMLNVFKQRLVAFNAW